MAALLPLFPLDVVLLPGTPIPLHIFEPRYKEMIGECMAQKTAFGVVRAKEDGIAEIGCTAEILDVTKRYDDGRLDIVCEGRRRFEVMGLNEERAFLQAEVTYFDDDPGSDPSDQVNEALRLYLDLIRLLDADAEAPEAETPQLSFQLAAPMPLDLDFKQALLGMRSERERIGAVVKYYEALLPRMRRAVKARKKAGGNGHAI
ncbi:MAG TPA: LON peptidase substrate-binding domain-containing protein [Terriglobales bacterium]|jgi:Lon protease-like protein|nr:LON peptidase substrate-binding domain-containing protein [Terriglobales bacterium]